MSKLGWFKVGFIFIVINLLIVLVSCGKEEEVVPDDNNGNQTVEIDEIDEFIWNGLKDYYLWVDLVPSLSSSAYADRAAFANFLNPYTDHEELFYDLLYQYGSVDKWSWIVDDYVELENYFQGITLSMGHEYGLVRIIGTDDIYGYVQYVVPETPADIAGIQRGEIFNKINDQTLNINNYRDLLFDLDSYKVSFVDYDGGNFTSNGRELDLIAVEVHENPVHISKTIDVDGTKVGYLVYNGFTASYDTQLNDAFGALIADGVEELIIDLRYNGGGSIQTSAYLASMIYAKNTSEIFTKSRYNDGVQAYLEEEYGSDYFNWMFEETITKGDISTPINSLNLSKIYFLVSDNSASASELVINGLRPYMEVILVGENTHGKYVGSITLKDYVGNSNTVNPNHFWAMQPIVLKLENAEGISDYVNGFTPDVFLNEGYFDLLELGDENEPLLKAALDHLKGISTAKSIISLDQIPVANSKSRFPFSKEMYTDFEKLKRK